MIKVAIIRQGRWSAIHFIESVPLIVGRQYGRRRRR
jgi:hypothetical protein